MAIAAAGIGTTPVVEDDDVDDVENPQDIQLNVNLIPSELKLYLNFLCSTTAMNGASKPMASVMVWGAPGIGKTDCVRQLAEKWNCRVVALHLPQYDPTDIKGIPVRDENGNVVWYPSSYFPREYVEDDLIGDCVTIRYDFPYAKAVSVEVYYNDELIAAHGRFHKKDIENEDAKIFVENPKSKVGINLTEKYDYSKIRVVVRDKAILFLDELSAAVPEVQNAALQLVLDRRVGEYNLPDDVPIIAAGNREDDSAFVNPMSAPLANRFCHATLVPNVQDWIENFAYPMKLRFDIISYVKQNPKALFDFNEDSLANGDMGWTSPRSWTHLSYQLQDDMPIKIQNAVIAGHIGKRYAVDFSTYRSVFMDPNFPNTDEILTGKLTEPKEDLELHIKFSLWVALCYKLHEYYEKYFSHEIFQKNRRDISDQPEEWQTAALCFCDFVSEHLSEEYIMNSINLLEKHLKMSLKTVLSAKRDDGGNEEWINTYRKYMREI